MFLRQKTAVIDRASALPGRDRAVLENPTFHELFGIPVQGTPAGSEIAYLALGCFWGAEKLFWQTSGVTNTAAGYQGGFTPNPTYEEVCSGGTAHAEVVRVAYDPSKINYADLLKIFFENHDPTQGMRQGNDVGTQYRSAIYTATDEQAEVAARVLDEFQGAFTAAGYDKITTAVVPAGEFFFAEDYHQQYLSSGKNPNGYCPIHATGVTCNPEPRPNRAGSCS